MLNTKLKVSEIFYSLQGEGARTGKPTVFIRLSGCSAKKACFKSGVICDTEYESYKKMTVLDLENWIKENAENCLDITWTGGEPLDQLNDDITGYFKSKNFFQAIETSGIRKPVKNLDFICVSPKVAEHILEKNFDEEVSEIKYVRHEGQGIPRPSIKAKHYWISPHSDGFTINQKNLKHCINLCLENPEWKLSVQSHKLWNIL